MAERSSMTATSTRGSLVIMMILLILVGLVSGTLLRHLVQILPLAVTLRLVWRSASPVGAYAAVGLFTFWFAIMVLIWLYLLGVSDIASGSFTPIEILLTVAIASSCLVGTLAAVRAGRSLAPVRRGMAILAAWAVQFGIMLVSFSEPFVNR